MMIFDRSDVDSLPDYGEVVDKEEVLRKVSEMMEREKLSFVPDYTGGNVVKLNDAEEFLIAVRKIIREL